MLVALRVEDQGPGGASNRGSRSRSGPRSGSRSGASEPRLNARPEPEEIRADKRPERHGALARVALDERAVVIADVLDPRDRREDLADVPAQAEARLEDWHGRLIDRQDGDVPLLAHDNGALDRRARDVGRARLEGGGE